MTIQIHKASKERPDIRFSILIPSWNNLDYLKACIESLETCSAFPHQLIAIANEGSQKMIEWLRSKDLDFIHSEHNLGICTGLNEGRKLVRSELIMYMNDDMIVTPHWDEALVLRTQALQGQKFMLSASLIEPEDTGNACVLVRNYGSDLESFDQNRLYADYKGLFRNDWYGSSWPPLVLPVALWDEVGGMSEAFSPGMYSDPDLSMKCWNAGTRIFQGLGTSLVYHFGSKSTRRLGKNKGRALFFQKWKMSSRQFYTYVLKMGSPYLGPLKENDLPASQKVINFFKRISFKT